MMNDYEWERSLLKTTKTEIVLAVIILIMIPVAFAQGVKVLAMGVELATTPTSTTIEYKDGVRYETSNYGFGEVEQKLDLPL